MVNMLIWLKFTQLTRKVLKICYTNYGYNEMLIAVYYCMADYNIWRMTYMEMWDIYDANKEKTGRLMKKNDWQLKDGEYHLTVLGVIDVRMEVPYYTACYD